jgi:two-component system chemotaxis sensor kinase CheA
MPDFNQATEANHLLDQHRRTTNRLASNLIVDDNDDLRRTLRNLFVDRGYRVRAAADGFSALAKMRSELLDVLISDLDMPRMNGFDAPPNRDHFVSR